jgi:apolipoprotein N-acyltransferase
MTVNPSALEVAAAAATAMMFTAVIFADFGLLFLPVFLCPLVVVCGRATSYWRAFVAGTASGFLSGLLTLWPLLYAVDWAGWKSASPQTMMLRAVFSAAVLAGLAATAGGFWGAFGICSRFAVQRLKLGAPAFVACSWVLLAEEARVDLLFDHHWALVGYSMATMPVVREIAILGGVLGLSWVVALLNGILAIGLMRSPHRLVFHSWILGAYTILVAAAGFACAKIPSNDGPRVRFRVLHDWPQADTLPGLLSSVAANSLVDSEERDPQIILAPESSVGGVLALTSETDLPGAGDPDKVVEWNRAAATFMEADQMIVFGADTAEHGRLHNSMIFMDYRGFMGAYHKRYLVPFAERSVLPIRVPTLDRSIDYSSGSAKRHFAADHLRVGSLICSEIAHAFAPRLAAQPDTDIVLTSANDSAITSTVVDRMHRNITVIRAIETGRLLARSSRGGTSLIVSYTGDVLASSRSRGQSVLDLATHSRWRNTPYLIIGNWIPVTAGIGLLIGVAVAYLRTSPTRE